MSQVASTGVQYGEPDPEYADKGIQIKHDRHASVRDVLRTEGMRSLDFTG